MSSTTLKGVLESLKSKKGSERQEGLHQIRIIFEKDRFVADFYLGKNGDADPKLWLPVFQALFTAVYLEREAMKKTTSRPGATRRIAEASSILRWLTERAVQYINVPVVNSLFQHLTQMLVSEEDRAVLCQPIALDYVKALKAMFTYIPHLEHLGTEQWIRMLEICFNVILGDRIRQQWASDEPMDASPSPAVEADDSMYLDDDYAENDGTYSPSVATGKGKKRTRRDPTPKPILETGSFRGKSTHVRTAVTAEQVEFTSILALLLSFAGAPVLSPDHPNLVPGIMTRLKQFLERYPADSSLLYDYVNVLSSMLEHISLNKKYEVEVFARSTWSALVGLWGTKDKHLKETLVAILRNLFQFIVCPGYPDDPKLPAFDPIDGIGVLWNALDAEADNKWGVDGLALDALRLNLAGADSLRSKQLDPFVAQTFCAGWHFDKEQAIAWAILELRADCAGKLYQLSESMQHSTPVGTSRSRGKRIKLENPIPSLLDSMRMASATHVRNYHLQTLLFFVDRHWKVVHDSQKQDIITTLLQYIAVEDSSVQSWVFLNFAAIANAEASRNYRKATDDIYALDIVVWDSIWAHAVRRANAPVICRAACHACHALLNSFYPDNSNSPQVFLTSSRVLVDIETLTKDMDVQGPTFPYDSVCIFLSHCLTIASQDARLYRLHLEDTVLSWLIDCWKLSQMRSKMPAYTIADILTMLQTISGLTKRVAIQHRPILPKSEIVDSMIRENKTKIILDFLLHAEVASSHPSSEPRRSHSASSNAVADKTTPPNESDRVLVMARGKERRISAFFLKALESLNIEWERPKDINYHTAEMTRQSLDLAISAVLFESMLALNGIVSNRIVLQNASKVVQLIIQSLNNPNWTPMEKLLVVQGFELLVREGETFQDGAYYQALSLPGAHSGIKEQTLRQLLSESANEQVQDDDKLSLLRVVWQNTEIQDALGAISSVLRQVVNDAMIKTPTRSRIYATDIDDRDGFAPIRTGNVQSSSPNMRKVENDRPLVRTIEICVGVLACGPFFQSPTSKPSRDKELVQTMLSKAEDHLEVFCLICPIFCSRVRQGMFSFPPKYVDLFLDAFEPLLMQHAHARSAQFQIVLLDLLSSCLGLWRSEDRAAQLVQEKATELYVFLAKELVKGRMKSWFLRDAFIRFMDKYLSDDPTQQSWASPADFNDMEKYRICLPTSLLPSLIADADIRVRFRAAVVNARLFSLVDELGIPPGDLYEMIKGFYIKEVSNYEHMLTRILSLGNIMIVSSAVRRGPYWHLLETCMYSQQYVQHIKAILSVVSERLGMSSLSELFVAYASQIAYSIRLANADITSFPPTLLGYKDRRKSAEAAFDLFTPTNLLNDGRQHFENHCKMLQKSTVDGLRDCFGEIVGLAIANWIGQSSEEDYQGLERHLIDLLSPMDDFWPTFEQHLDRIVTMILCCLGEQNYLEAGPIAEDLKAFDQYFNGKSASTFLLLNVYRASDTFKPHPPNLPNFSTQTLLNSLHWITSRLPNAFTRATTYHVLHLLMNKIHDTPLVNEQHRLINALTLWMAFRQGDLEDAAILNTIIHGATLMLAQFDLIRSAQSILELAFHHYKGLRSDDIAGAVQYSHLPNFLLRICCIAHDSHTVGKSSISDSGNDLVAWIDRQALSLSKVAEFKPIVSRALAAWPHQPSSELLEFYQEVILMDLATILEDPHLSYNKFRLARRMRDQIVSDYDNESQYWKVHFWRLKECMPPSNQLQDDDLAAFIELLSANRGEISPFNTEPVDFNAPRPRHRRMFKKKGTKDNNPVIMTLDAITLGLLAMLEDSNAKHVSSAYHTLRLIMSVSSPQNFSYIPSEYRMEINFLKCYKLMPVHRPVPNIKDVLASDTYIASARDFKTWVTSIAVLLGDTLAVCDPFFGQLSSILMSDTEFAEQILPILVQTLLSLQGSDKLNHLTDSLNIILSTYFTDILLATDTDPACIRAVVDIVLHLRYFTPKTDDSLAYNKWLRVDYILLAKSAVVCGAYTTALLFVEIAVDQGVEWNGNQAIERVLYDIYAHIDEPDGFYAIQTRDLHRFLIKRLHHEDQWDKAFRFHGAALEAGSAGDETKGLLDSFHHFGFDRLAIATARSLPKNSIADSSASSLTDYNLAWRTETWDLPDQAKNTANGAVYRSLRAIHLERDLQLVDRIIHSAIVTDMDHLRTLGSENLVEIRSVARDLMCLGEIHKWRNLKIQDLIRFEDTSPDSWKEFIDIHPEFEFADLEPIMATRISLLRSVRQKEERQQIGTMVRPFVKRLIKLEQACLIRLSQTARASGQLQIALNSIMRAQRLSSDHTAESSAEFAHVLWAQKEEKLAVQFLSSLLIDDGILPGDLGNIERRAILLSRLGTWISEACLENPADIMARYFKPSVSLLEKIKEDKGQYGASHAKVYRQCAMFSERQYYTMLKSPDALRYKMYVDRKQAEIVSRQGELDKMVDKKSTEYKKKDAERKTALSIFNEDFERIKQFYDLRDASLRQAISMHALCLESSDDFNEDSAIRLCSLWFTNFDNQSIIECLKDALNRIPSRKFAFLAHQLTARLATLQSDNVNSSQENLHMLILRLCQEHPFHIIYQVYCLTDQTIVSGTRRQSSIQSQSTQTERGTVASTMLDRLRSDINTGKRVQDMVYLCDSYLEWAKFPIAKDTRFQTKQKNPFQIPSRLKILKITNLRVPVTTAHVPPDSTLQYQNCTWIQSYEPTFTTAGGVNVPKISVCRGSDGQKYKQLFKGEGKDDMRQDAVMKQVFDLVNGVLKRDRKTRRRELTVRNYKIVPLASQAGLLEFVENTTPLKDWLVKAHPAYRPQDMKPHEAHKGIAVVSDVSTTSAQQKLDNFLQIRERLKPVLHHYFTEKHKNPIHWFQMRLSYTRSVATNSIVGHVLGLGDRHVSNILLDNVSGEVVHIDLGIAFDQGKRLPVPEKVPFRMTADIVDGMGPAGTAGVFQRCAEETFRVLREESEMIMTVLEVFKHDPLYSWTASAHKVNTAQPQIRDPNLANFGISIDMSSDTVEESADRALNSVARKLDKSLSVESAVNELLAEATDPMNLACMYSGWQAAL